MEGKGCETPDRSGGEYMEVEDHGAKLLGLVPESDRGKKKVDEDGKVDKVRRQLGSFEGVLRSACRAILDGLIGLRERIRALSRPGRVVCDCELVYAPEKAQG